MIEFSTDTAQTFLNNAQIAAFARELGVMDSLLDSSGLVHAVTGVLHRRHPSHWLLFLCFTGMAEPADNGLILRSLPKISVTETQATAEFDAMLAGAEPADPIRKRIIG